MVHVTFYNLLRSKYGIHSLEVSPGSIHDIIGEIIERHPEIEIKHLESAVVFFQGKPLHLRAFHVTIPDNERIVFTHFVGGG